MAAFCFRVPKAVAVCALALFGTLPWPCAAPTVAAAQDLSSPSVWRVRLVSPLKASFNRKGDVIAASVLDPVEYKDSMIEGQMREVRAGDQAHGAYMEFEFLALHLGGKVLPVTADLLGAVNSRGQSGVDEDGSQVESGSRSLVGRLTSKVRFRSGSARLAVLAPDMSFAPGSEFALRVRYGKNRRVETSGPY